MPDTGDGLGSGDGKDGDRLWLGFGEGDGATLSTAPGMVVSKYCMHS